MLLGELSSPATIAPWLMYPYGETSPRPYTLYHNNMKIIRVKRSGRPTGQMKLSKMLNTGTPEGQMDVLGGIAMLLEHHKVGALITQYQAHGLI